EEPVRSLGPVRPRHQDQGGRGGGIFLPGPRGAPDEKERRGESGLPEVPGARAQRLPRRRREGPLEEHQVIGPPIALVPWGRALRPPARSRLLKLIGLLPLVAAAACRRDSNVFPNAPVILICVDTLRADHLPVYGYKGVETPAIDGLARDSVVFDNAVSQVPLTLPSPASLLTGLLPFQEGVRDNVGYRLDKSRTTLASHLHARGYVTGAAVSAFVLDHTTGISSGFDFYEDRVEARRSGLAIGEVQRPGAETERLLEGWVASVPAEKPFFAFLHLYEPHAPYSPPEPFPGPYPARPHA